jgi:hypothetical protein
VSWACGSRRSAGFSEVLVVGAGGGVRQRIGIVVIVLKAVVMATAAPAEVVGHDREGEPGGVGHEVARRQVGQSGALELGDALLDHGVPAVVGLHLDHVAVAVGDIRVEVPRGEQCELRTGGGRSRRTTRRTVRAWRLSPAKQV